MGHPGKKDTVQVYSIFLFAINGFLEIKGGNRTLYKNPKLCRLRPVSVPLGYEDFPCRGSWAELVEPPPIVPVRELLSQSKGLPSIPSLPGPCPVAAEDSSFAVGTFFGDFFLGAFSVVSLWRSSRLNLNKFSGNR